MARVILEGIDNYSENNTNIECELSEDYIYMTFDGTSDPASVTKEEFSVKIPLKDLEFMVRAFTKEQI